MKYTPEELYDYFVEKGLLLALHDSINKGEEGFRYFMVPAHLSLDGKTLFIKTCMGEKNIYLENLEDGSPELPVLGNVIICVYSSYRVSYDIILPSHCRPLPDDRNSAEWAEIAKENVRELWECLFILFFQMYLQMNGAYFGQLKVLLDVGQRPSPIGDKKEELRIRIKYYIQMMAYMYKGINLNGAILDDVIGTTFIANEVFQEMVSEPEFPKQLVGDELRKFIDFDPDKV